jgi:hypothetical protein
METVFFVLIGFALLGLLVWNILLSWWLKDLDGKTKRRIWDATDELDRANRNRVNEVIRLHNDLCDSFAMVMKYLGIEIVPAKKEVVKIEKIKKEGQ